MAVKEISKEIVEFHNLFGRIPNGNLVIPRITDPLGRSWEQPNTELLRITDEFVYISTHAFTFLKDYTNSQPTGVYPGKIWKVKMFTDKTKIPIWVLRWFGNSDDPNYVTNHWREIAIIYRIPEILESFKRIK